MTLSSSALLYHFSHFFGALLSLPPTYSCLLVQLCDCYPLPGKQRWCRTKETTSSSMQLKRHRKELSWACKILSLVKLTMTHFKESLSMLVWSNEACVSVDFLVFEALSTYVYAFSRARRTCVSCSKKEKIIEPRPKNILVILKNN